MGPRLLRWAVLGLVVAWVVYVVLLLTSAETDGVAVDIAWTVALLAPTAWTALRPGPLSGAVAVVVVWPLAALTVTAMLVLPVLVVAEAMVVVATVRHHPGRRSSTPPDGLPASGGSVGGVVGGSDVGGDAPPVGDRQPP